MPETVVRLQEFFPLYRARAPVEGEQVRMTLVGAPEGAPRRQMVRLFVAVLGLATVAGLIGGSAGNALPWSLAGAVGGFVMGVVLVPARDLPVGVVVTDQRVVWAQQRRRQEPRVEVHPRSWVTAASVDPVVEPHRSFEVVKASRVTFSGAEGVVTVMDLTAIGPDAVRLVLQEAGLELAVPTDAGVHAPEPVDRGRFWFARAFVVGFLYFVGCGYVLIAVAVGLDTGVRDGLAALAVAAVLLLVGEGLRRVLFRRR